jgi:CheY-like chemotaxis protein
MDIAADVPRSVVLDGRHLRQALLNLLGNAVKFTDSGDVRLAITRAAGHLSFEVRDTGIGIESDALAEIFEAFSQTRSGAAAGGTGLGLTICNHLVTRMGGELKVESAVGAGSRFWFTLPLVAARGAARAPGHDTDTSIPPLDARLAPGEALTALVVDDSTANRRILASLLESAGVDVITAAGGLEAIGIARTHRPDVIFMDLKMSDLDGLEATRRLQRDPATAAIPVIAVTASAFGDVRQAARDAGCVDYLSKPIRAQLLFGLLHTHLGVRFAGGSESADAPDAAVHIGHHAEVAARLRTALTMGDIGEIQALAQQLVESGTADAPLGERIGRLAAAFDFEGLGALADSLAASA